MITKVGHGDPPTNGNTVTLCDYLLYIDVKVRKGPDEGAMDSLERFGPGKNGVCVGKAAACARGRRVGGILINSYGFLQKTLGKPQSSPPGDWLRFARCAKM